jgi:hypothetical protein
VKIGGILGMIYLPTCPKLPSGMLNVNAIACTRIGAPLALVDIAILLYDDLTPRRRHDIGATIIKVLYISAFHNKPNLKP